MSNFFPHLMRLHFHFSCVRFQGPLVGMNPVQIRATVDLYPSSRPSLGGSIHHSEAPAGWLIQRLKRSPFTTLTNALFQHSHRGICWLGHLAKTSTWIVPPCFAVTTKTQLCRLKEWIREIKLNLITVQTKMAVECGGWWVVDIAHWFQALTLKNKPVRKIDPSHFF